MSWQTECTRLLRHMINDLGVSPKYGDDRLEELIIVAAQFVQQEVSLTQVYVVDLDECKLDPDPTVRTNRDDSFINLILLKAACIIDQSEARSASGKAISISDSGSRIDLRGNLAGALKILEKGWCEAYKETKLEYELDRMGTAGKAILSPFRTDLMNSYGVEWR